MQEIYREIKGFNGIYSVSTKGNVRNNKTGRILKTFLRNGYERVGLSNKGKRKNYSVHRLVAESFLGNYNAKPNVDHINTVRNDNRAINLRWTTQKENMNNELTKLKRRKIR